MQGEKGASGPVRLGGSELLGFTSLVAEKWLGLGGGVYLAEVRCVSPQDGSVHRHR